MSASDSHNPNRPELDLLFDLMRRRSVTPDDAGCQDLIGARLEAAGFTCETMPFADVTNLWARRGKSSPVFCFAGHTDVVPAGNLDDWQSDPFEPNVRDGRIYGRGSADMKSGLAAMIVATEHFVADHPDHEGSIAFLITSDEEGRARDGTLKVIEELNARNESIDWCVIGEPSSHEALGDMIRIGRRGSLSGMLEVQSRTTRSGASPPSCRNCMASSGTKATSTSRRRVSRSSTCRAGSGHRM
jgi:succinyl-diaminopimelate desuccinylase